MGQLREERNLDRRSLLDADKRLYEKGQVRWVWLLSMVSDEDQGINKSTEQPAAETIQEGDPFQKLDEQHAKGWNKICVHGLA